MSVAQSVELDHDPYELSPELLHFQEVCRALVERELRPQVDQAERAGRFPVEVFPALGAAGLLGIGHPLEHGGTGGGMLARTILAEELARASGGIAVTILVSSYMAGPHLSHFGTPEQQLRHVGPMCRGERIFAIAVTEPGAGSDVASIKTSARRGEGGWHLNGTKMFITNAGIADVLVVAAKTEPESGHRGISTFLVEVPQDGLSFGEPLRKMGWHSSDTREVVLDDVFVPDERVLGELGRGFHQIMYAFERERVLLAAMGLGVAQAAFEDALAYAREREAFGATIGSYQGVRHPLARMSAEIEAARLLTYQAAQRLDSGHPRASDSAAMAKLLAARMANDVVDDAVQVFGGAGYLEETPVAMHYRDARILRIGGGTDEVQMEILAKRLKL